MSDEPTLGKLSSNCVADSFPGKAPTSDVASSEVTDVTFDATRSELAPRRPSAPPHEQTPKSRAGRNLPAAIGVGLGLLAIVAASLAFRPEPFLVIVVAAVVGGTWELRTAFSKRGIKLAAAPLIVGGSGTVISAFYGGADAMLIAYVLTIAASCLWVVLEGLGSTTTALRDASAQVFAATYVALLAGFVVLILGLPDGNWKVVWFILLAVANDTGGYLFGVLFGKHRLAPSISPKKTWEGAAGSVALTCLVGIMGALWVLRLPFWPDAAATLLRSALGLGIVLALFTAFTATLGDLAESLLKRDLGLKDMGHLLPGHGGVLDRVDSILVTAPFVYLMLLWATSAVGY